MALGRRGDSKHTHPLREIKPLVLHFPDWWLRRGLTVSRARKRQQAVCDVFAVKHNIITGLVAMRRGGLSNREPGYSPRCFFEVTEAKNMERSLRGAKVTKNSEDVLGWTAVV